MKSTKTYDLIMFFLFIYVIKLERVTLVAVLVYYIKMQMTTSFNYLNEITYIIH